MFERMSRRRLLGVTAGGLAALAGCSGGGGSTATQEGNAPQAVKNWLANASNFGGSLTDRTGTDAVTVEVGTEGNSGYNAYTPAAVKVGTGTTVTWEWTGRGSAHNVVEADGAFDSGPAQTSGTFEHTFEEAGRFFYYCLPHKGMGMKGAVVVE